MPDLLRKIMHNLIDNRLQDLARISLCSGKIMPDSYKVFA